MIPLDDRGKSVQEMRRDWTKMIQFLESVLAYRYTPETEVLLLLARNNLDEIEIEVRPSTTEPLLGQRHFGMIKMETPFTMYLKQYVKSRTFYRITMMKKPTLINIKEVL